MTTTHETNPKTRERRDRVLLALDAIGRLSIDELATFAAKLKQNTPRLAAALTNELNTVPSIQGVTVS